MPQKKKLKLPLNPSPQDQLRYNAILLEEVRSQMGVVIETVETTGQRLDEKIDKVHVELKQEIQLTQMAIREHSQEIKGLQQETKTLQQDVRRLDQKIDGVEQRLDKKIDGVEQSLNKKIDGVEQRLGEKIDRIGDKVEQHDEDIGRLKSAVFPA